MVRNRRGRVRRGRGEGGFTLIEFMIAALITTAVLGGTVMLASQLQQAYTTQLDDTLVEEEARFSLDWIERILRNAGSNPYSVNAAACAAATFTAIEMDPNGDGEDNDIRIHADVNPPDGLLGGDGIDCDQEGEDVTIAFDEDAMVITKQDNNVDGAPVTMTEPVIVDLEFTYLDSNRNPTAIANLVTYIGVRVVGQSAVEQALNDEDTAFTTTTLETEVHVRTR